MVNQKILSDTIESDKDRNEARRNKNFDMADEIRKNLKKKGLKLKTLLMVLFGEVSNG